MDLVETNSTSNSSSLCTVNKEFTFHFLPAVYLIVFLVGLVGNGVGLWNLCINQKKWTSVNVYVANLGIADLLYVITLPFFVSYYTKKEVWPFGYGFCRLTRCLFHVNMYASISFLTCISIQRYLGIVHPLKTMVKYQSLRQAFVITALVWLWVIVQVALSFLITKDDINPDQCHDSTSNKDENVKRYALYTIILTFTGFFIPFLIIVVCYARVLNVLWKNKNMDPAAKRKVIKLISIVLALFFVCFFPFYILRNFNLVSRIWQLQGKCSLALKNTYIAYQVTRGLASMNSAINPLLYFVTGENFLSQFKKVKRKTWHACVYIGRTRNPTLTANADG
ncbi:hypothetical protein XENTR_v10004160 [Xenopus tropicalis]|uniref:P2Y purinoceptor 1 n=1 Tax=Xenopus tropicalis TaxID=8364 RepID=A0A6I8PMQ1_XENTR|nr:P2Y purinoceptor 1 [Xenopus tropicalis]KAE8576388.1 hypothetical protein XENTR_v10004160 [Xenopus tropicalis]